MRTAPTSWNIILHTDNTFKRKGEYKTMDFWEEEFSSLIDLMSELVLDQIAEWLLIDWSWLWSVFFIAVKAMENECEGLAS